MSTTTTHPRAMKPQQFADLIGLSRTTIYEMIAAGQLRSVKVGGARLIPVTEADRILNAASESD